MTKGTSDEVGFSTSANNHLLADFHALPIKTEQVESVGSSEMGIGRVIHLAQRILAWQQPDTKGIVITHGSDALEDTAFLLTCLLADKLTCPVVLIAAMRASGEPDYDGPTNLTQAIKWIDFWHQNQPPLPTVVVVMNGQAHHPFLVQKQHTTSISAFDAKDPLAFYRSTQWQVHALPKFLPPPFFSIDLFTEKKEIPSVEIISFYPGSEGTVLSLLTPKNCDGVVLSAIGCGNVNQQNFDLLKRILQQNIPVVISTRVPYGSTSAQYNYPGGGATLQRAGALFSGSLRPNQSRLLLLLTLLSGQTPSVTFESFQNTEYQ